MATKSNMQDCMFPNLRKKENKEKDMQNCPTISG
jgi:hypothetical protein